MTTEHAGSAAAQPSAASDGSPETERNTDKDSLQNTTPARTGSAPYGVFSERLAAPRRNAGGQHPGDDGTGAVAHSRTPAITSGEEETMSEPNETTEPSGASGGSAITARQLFESLTHRQRVMLLEAIGTVPRWVVTGNAIQRTAAAPVVFFRAYRSHRRHGMTLREAAYWAWRWAQAFCF